MKVSANGIAMIKRFEGCRLRAYKDAVGVWTIGYGITSADRAITGKEIKSGLTITQAQADEWLEKSLNQKYAKTVEKYDNIYHWNQNQFDALISFAYNIGSIDKLTDKGKRTIAQISAKIPDFCHAGGKVLQGLVNRRNEEKRLFDKPVSSKPVSTVENPFREPTALVTSNSNAKKCKLKMWQASGIGVQWVQWYLSRYSESFKTRLNRAGGIDGECGAVTVALITQFQTDRKLEVDGICGKNTRAELKKIK